MKIMSDNLVDAAEVATTSQNSEFPATNIQNIRLSKPYKTGVDTLGVIVFIGSEGLVQPEVLIVAGHDFDLSPEIGELTLAAGDDTGLTGVSYNVPTQAGTFLFDIAAATPASGAAGAYRIWALVFNKVSASDVKKIGRVYLGPRLDTTDLGDPDYDGLTETTRDRSEADESIGGQEYLERKNQVRSWMLDLSVVPESVMTGIIDVYNRVGKGVPFFIKISDQSPLDEIIYVRFTNDLGRKVDSFNDEFNWNTAAALKEFI